MKINVCRQKCLHGGTKSSAGQLFLLLKSLRGQFHPAKKKNIYIYIV